MKLPWQKNFLKVPKELTERVNNIESDNIIISAAKRVLKKDINNGLYQHLNIYYRDDKLFYEPSILPSPKVGRYSKYNVNGREIVLKDLPKIPKSYSREVPNFGDWSKGTHDITRDIMVYPRKYWLPKNINVDVELLETTENSYVFKFSLDTIISKNSDDFEEELLYHANLLQENCGVCNTFEANANDEDYIKTLYVNWELLPIGTRSINSNIDYILTKFKNPSSQMKETVKERMEFLKELGADTIVLGTNKFNRYIGAKFEDKDIILLENFRYGNAIYVFLNNWEELSKLSRTKLLKNNDKDFARITHVGNWKEKVKDVIG